MHIATFLPLVLAMGAMAAPLAAPSDTTPSATPDGVDATPNGSATATNDGGETALSDDSITVHKGWGLGPLGSGTAQVDCPEGYNVGTMFYTISSSNGWVSAVSGVTTNPHQTYGTAALTNWSLEHQTTQLSLVCYRD